MQGGADKGHILMKFEIIEVLMLLGSVQGIILALTLLFRKSRHRLLDLPFAIVLLIIAYELFLFAFMKSGNIIQFFPALVGTSFPMTFLIGPLYYIHVRSLLEGRLQLRLYDVFHLVPWLYVIYELSPFILASNTAKILHIHYVHLNSQPHALSNQTLFYVWFNLIVMAIYFYITQQLLMKKEQELSLVSSNAGVMENLIRLRKLTIGYGVYVLGFGVVATCLSMMKTYGVIIDGYWMIFKSIIIYAIGYQRFQFVTGSIPLPMANDPSLANASNDFRMENEAQSDDEKYRKSGLSMDQANYYYDRLCKMMETDQIYRESELKLSTLADSLSITPNQLSQTINQCAGKSFYDFVNGYRIEHAKQLLKTKPDETVLDIALSVGFSNKATFNRVFKQFTQMTPTTFIRQEI
jgi:AraC-like DNA-binding protein